MVSRLFWNVLNLLKFFKTSEALKRFLRRSDELWNVFEVSWTFLQKIWSILNISKYFEKFKKICIFEKILKNLKLWKKFRQFYIFKLIFNNFKRQNPNRLPSNPPSVKPQKNPNFHNFQLVTTPQKHFHIRGFIFSSPFANIIFKFFHNYPHIRLHTLFFPIVVISWDNRWYSVCKREKLRFYGYFCLLTNPRL